MKQGKHAQGKEQQLPISAYTVPCSGVDTLLKTGSAHLPRLYKQPGYAHRQTGRKILEVSGIAHMSSGTVYWISRGGGREGADPILPSTRQNGLKERESFQHSSSTLPSHLHDACPSLKSPQHLPSQWSASLGAQENYLPNDSVQVPSELCTLKKTKL